jgi:Mn2+/Fe2+ NRAMP family transporter
MPYPVERRGRMNPFKRHSWPLTTLRAGVTFSHRRLATKALLSGCVLVGALQPDVASASINRRTSMTKYAIGAALLVAFTAPVLATSGTTTTTTTGGSTTTTSEQYYLVRDPSTKKCTVTTTKPTSSTTVVVGDTVYKTRTEAEGAVKTTKVCTE